VKTRAIALATLALLGAGAGSAHGAPAPVHKAPSSPPLVSGEAGTGDAVGEEGAGETPQAEVDPLVSNGLGSPTCRGALAGELDATNRRNCETSGFVAAPAPTGDYGIDVHINTGLFGLGTGGGLSFVQDLIITPLWMALVWAVHALVVMLEWCFTIDLLDGGTAVGVGRGLREMQAAFTEPWLPIALASASVLVLYHGLIRRRVADTLGEALLMGAMMVAGIWVITDPMGTVGALGEWANEASLGTLAVTSSGSPARAGGALGTSLEGIFSSAIEAPWCYLEFGDVAWCREPSRLDPSLRAAGLKIAAREIAQTACQASSALLEECTVPSSAQAKALEHSAELLREARTNGAIFLALPANGPARNSINEQGSLLRTLCQSSEATNCRGPTAAQAEFRTDGGTWSRLGGLLLIAAGLLGMLLLLGFVALRLLAAAIFSLLYLLLAPAMVLAPAFGETGRALFRRWAAQLLGAIVSKLVFSFLLGAMFAVLAILSGLNALGWWTQWLLMSAFWWGAYTRRHHALGAAGGALAGHGGAGEHASRRSIARRVSEAFETPRRGIAAARWAKSRLSRPAPEVQARKLARVGRERARAGADEQVIRTLEGEHRDASAQARDAPKINRRLDDRRAQLERIGRERANALALGDMRRAAELGHRGDRVKGEIERGQQQLNRARRVASAGDRALRGTGRAHTREQRDERDRFLDAQAALPANARAGRASERRDYAAMSQLAGYGREEYERLDPRRQRAARLEIDRELALRRELTETARSFGEDVPRVGRRERRKADMEFDGALQTRMRADGHGMPASRTERTALDSWLAAGRAESSSTPDRASGEPESSVMRDAREVAARRKRQLGRDRP
jgi:TrbL/VirB6 plasmid conjugal transfer protein